MEQTCPSSTDNPLGFLTPNRTRWDYDNDYLHRENSLDELDILGFSQIDNYSRPESLTSADKRSIKEKYTRPLKQLKEHKARAEHHGQLLDKCKRDGQYPRKLLSPLYDNMESTRSFLQVPFKNDPAFLRDLHELTDSFASSLCDILQNHWHTTAANNKGKLGDISLKSVGIADHKNKLAEEYAHAITCRDDEKLAHLKKFLAQKRLNKGTDYITLKEIRRQSAGRDADNSSGSDHFSQCESIDTGLMEHNSLRLASTPIERDDVRMSTSEIIEFLEDKSPDHEQASGSNNNPIRAILDSSPNSTNPVGAGPASPPKIESHTDKMKAEAENPVKQPRRKRKSLEERIESAAKRLALDPGTKEKNGGI